MDMVFKKASRGLVIYFCWWIIIEMDRVIGHPLTGRAMSWDVSSSCCTRAWGKAEIARPAPTRRLMVSGHQRSINLVDGIL